ncbi:hypothetical protein [Sphingomonas phyllosphaerae]|uniref:hypothetical protein n=1 Tax=Sphingomonas phyllosphaerae TaxID=257003 RepID=UPI0003B5312D|nr:hypothetical protein [Sphingomonas phyllosphaerae]
MIDHKVPARTGAPVGVALVVTAVAVAYASLKLYDEPVRRWLGRRLLRRGQASTIRIFGGRAAAKPRVPLT